SEVPRSDTAHERFSSRDGSTAILSQNRWCRAVKGSFKSSPALVFPPSILYKPAFACDLGLHPWLSLIRWKISRSYGHGRSQTKTLAVETRNAPFCRCAGQTHLCRRQGFR